MKLEAINDNVVIKLEREEAKELKTEKGFILSSKSPESKPDRGEVVAVGQGRITANGNIVPLTVKKGETVIFNKFAGTELAVGEDRYLILKESDILIKVK